MQTQHTRQSDSYYEQMRYLLAKGTYLTFNCSFCCGLKVDLNDPQPLFHFIMVHVLTDLIRYWAEIDLSGLASCWHAKKLNCHDIYHSIDLSVPQCCSSSSSNLFPYFIAPNRENANVSVYMFLSDCSCQQPVQGFIPHAQKY